MRFVQMAIVIGAAEEPRTLDLNLGKVALYQLSYCRTTCRRSRRACCLTCEPHCPQQTPPARPYFERSLARSPRADRGGNACTKPHSELSKSLPENRRQPPIRRRLVLLVDAEGIEPSPRRADYRFTVCGDLSQYSPRIHVQEPPKARSPDCFRWSGLPCGCLNLSIVEVVLSPSRTLPAIVLPTVSKRAGVRGAGDGQLRLGCRTNGCTMA